MGTLDGGIFNFHTIAWMPEPYVFAARSALPGTCRSANAGEALNFGEVVRAVDYAFSHGLWEVRVVIKFQNSRLDLPLPPMHSVA